MVVEKTLLFQCLVLWLALAPTLTVSELLAGGIVSLAGVSLFGVVFHKDSVMSPKPGNLPRFLIRFGFALIILVCFVIEVFVSAVRLARMILCNQSGVSYVVSYTVSLKSPLGITVLSSLVTLTPGTLAIDYVPEQKALYIHCLTDSADQPSLTGVRRLERLIKRVTEC